jgi:hypothetical protein
MRLIAPAIAKRVFAGCCSPGYASFCRKGRTRQESGMEKLLNSLTGTIIAGFVLTVIEVLLIHAIH